jgi:hypothetical protein
LIALGAAPADHFEFESLGHSKLRLERRSDGLNHWHRAGMGHAHVGDFGLENANTFAAAITAGHEGVAGARAD